MHGPNSGRARLRGLFAVVATLGALAALSVLAGASWSATGSSTANQYQYGTKVTICHHTHSKKHPQVTITVGQAAVKAHLKHGDTLGPCPTSSSTKTKTQGDDSSGSTSDNDGDSDDDSGSTANSSSTGDSGHGHGGGGGHGHGH